MKRLLTVCMVAMLALGLMGFGFAKWSDTITIDTTVNTGNVVIGINDAGTTDPYDGNFDYPGPGADPQYWDSNLNEGGKNTEGKDVASIDSVNGTPLAGYTGWYESITEEVKNAYPYYKPGTKIEVSSLGSVPVKIEDLSVVWSGALADNVHIADFTVTYPNGTTKTGTTAAELKAAIEGVQMHQNDKIVLDINVYFDQQSEMLESATATITVTGSQWNEVSIADPSTI